MSDVAIIASAGAGLAALIILFVFGLKLVDAKDAASAAAVDAATKAGTIAIRDATVATLTVALATEKERADAIDAELFKDTDPGDAAGARERVLQAWRDRAAASSTARTGPIPVPVASAAKPT